MIYPASSLFAIIVNKSTAIYSQQHKNFTENAVKSIIAETIVNEITGKENEEAILNKAMRDYFGIPYSKDNNNPIILDDSFKSNIGKDISKRVKVESVNSFGVPGIIMIYGTFDTRTGDDE